MQIRAYETSDRDACLAVFDSNTPEYFESAERDDFANFIDRASCPFVVVITPEGNLVGCGGHYQKDDHTAGLAWGMVARAWHRRGVGRMLLEHRIAALQKDGSKLVTVRTSQHSRGFFERCGFHVVHVEPGGLTPRIDLVVLTRDL